MFADKVAKLIKHDKRLNVPKIDFTQPPLMDTVAIMKMLYGEIIMLLLQIRNI